MRRIKLVKIGSDPELAFASVAEWQHQLVPATDVITSNKALGLTTFIGLDGHASTAELRPPPSRNIMRHMMDLATGITSIDAYLSRVKKWKDRKVAMYARPVVAKEMLGGHVHVSVLVDDPDMKKAQDLNVVYNALAGGWTVWDKNKPQSSHGHSALLESVASRVLSNETFGTAIFSHALGFLMRPFESWVQPWPDRIARNSKYGNPNDAVRFGFSPRPTSALYKDWAYLHYEYRLPSTPLVHPIIAYAYLALTKLTMVNFRKIAEYIIAHPYTDIKSVAPENARCFQQFKDRLALLEKNGLRYTADTRDLRDATESILKYREDWYNPYKAVDVKAWSKWAAS